MNFKKSAEVKFVDRYLRVLLILHLCLACLQYLALTTASAQIAKNGKGFNIIERLGELGRSFDKGNELSKSQLDDISRTIKSIAPYRDQLSQDTQHLYEYVVFLNRLKSGEKISENSVNRLLKLAWSRPLKKNIYNALIPYFLSIGNLDKINFLFKSLRKMKGKFGIEAKHLELILTLSKKSLRSLKPTIKAIALKPVPDHHSIMALQLIIADDLANRYRMISQNF